MSQPAIKWTPEEDIKLRDLLRKGNTVMACATRLNRSYRSVESRMRRLRGWERTDTLMEGAAKLIKQSIVPYAAKNPPQKVTKPLANEALERVLLIPDVHVPFEDEVAWKTMMVAAKFLKPHTIVILGDFLDMMAVSSHDKSKSDQGVQLRSEIEAGNRRLDEVDALGASRKIFCEGNHETRGQRLASKMAMGLWDALATQELLHLSERAWEFVPYRSHINVGKLYCTHDTGVAGKYAHSQSGAAFEASVAHGHTHRAAISYFGSVTGETHVAGMFGWLGDKKAADYLPEIRKKDWQHGFGIAYVERKTGNAHVSFVPIISGTCVVAGTIITHKRGT